MSYNRTIHCHYCWEKGHNVKSCETLINDVKNNVGGSTHRRYRKYFDSDGTRKQASVVKKCSYCNITGHTKRTCDVRIGDLAHNIKTNAKYRKNMFQYLAKEGFGEGSLITILKGFYLVTGINWDNFTCGNIEYSKKHLLLQPMDTSSHHYFFDFDDYFIKAYINSNVGSDIVKVESRSEPVRPPEEWFTGRTSFYKDFKGRISNPFNPFS